MDVIEVIARFAKDGKIYPQRFSWQGIDYLVESNGRRWQDEEGLHILVMIPGERVVELIYQANQGLWYLKQLPSGRQMA
jgi:hypothetical protein